MTRNRLLVVAGEASGDQRAARLVTELGARRPGLEVFGLGGDDLIAAGCRIVAHSREIAVVGISEALRVLPRAREIFAGLLDEVDRDPPLAAVLVDSPEFNLRLAAQLARRDIPVVYYVSPQVWAWRRGRVRKIASSVDLMLVLFDFEETFFRERGIDAVHVGHPLVDEVPVLEQAWDRDGASFRGPFRISLLPGSRRSEIEHLLPSMLDAAQRLVQVLPVEPRIIVAPTVPRSLVEKHMERAGATFELVERGRFEAIADSHLAICASGTATLEVGLLGTPMVVAYRLTPISYLLARALVRLPHFSLVNLVLGRGVVPELLQRQAAGPALAKAVAGLLGDPARITAMRADLATLRSRLGAPGASRRAAEQVESLLARLEVPA
ncbi:MAG: lipid-A-disaccharide synthase [Holophagales bacterium]|nr:MAG: lipid-A-disaccharide synthase [Holophagales bacterium]